MKKLILSSILIAMFAMAFAQQNTADPDQAKRYKGLGLHFGQLSGNGFSYRVFSKNHGLQYTLGGITLGSNSRYFDNSFYAEGPGPSVITIKDDGRRTNINFGINYLETLANNQTGRFYVFGGASVLFSRVKQFERDYQLSGSSGTYYNLMNTPERVSWDNRRYYHVGAGLGFDFKLGQNFHWVLELPLTMNQDQEFMMYIPQVGLYYYFN